LGYIIDYFKRLGFQLSPIYYAVEKLTEAKMHIDTLNVASIIEKLTEMHIQMEEDEAKVKESKKYKPILPKFIRIQLNRDKGLLPLLKVNKLRRFRNFAEWKAQFCGIDSAETRDANGNNADCTPQECGSNSNNYKQQLQTERENEGTPTSAIPEQDDPSLPSFTQSSSSQEKDLSTANVNNCLPDVDKPPVHVANETIRSGPTTEPLDPSKLVETLSSEEKRVFDLLCEVFYAIAPEVITPKIKKQCADLAPHVHNAEDLKSLKDYTRTEIMNDPAYKKKQAHLGNLVSFVNGWKQEQENKKKLAEPAKPSKQSSQIEDLKAIRARVLAQAQAGVN
jgi:hypothetical protein